MLLVHVISACSSGSVCSPVEFAVTRHKTKLKVRCSPASRMVISTSLVLSNATALLGKARQLYLSLSSPLPPSLSLSHVKGLCSLQFSV